MVRPLNISVRRFRLSLLLVELRKIFFPLRQPLPVDESHPPAEDTLILRPISVARVVAPICFDERLQQVFLALTSVHRRRFLAHPPKRLILRKDFSRPRQFGHQLQKLRKRLFRICERAVGGGGFRKFQLRLGEELGESGALTSLQIAGRRATGVRRVQHVVFLWATSFSSGGNNHGSFSGGDEMTGEQK